jgi:4-carboxymuconolactone decarboxylase
MSLVGDPGLYKLGAELRGAVQGTERLSQALRDEDDLDEFYHLFGHEVCYAQVWSRDGLSRLERALATFTMIATMAPASSTLRVHVRGALRSGCTRAHLRQVLAMITWYAGVPVGCQATETVRATLAVLQENQTPEESLASINEPVDASVDLVARGQEIRRSLFGAQPERSDTSTAHQAHERMIDSHYFGVLWSNADLTLKQRCLVLLGVMCGSNRMNDAQTWFAAALRLGYQPAELGEVVLSAGAYCGELTYSHAQQALTAAIAAQRP